MICGLRELTQRSRYALLIAHTDKAERDLDTLEFEKSLLSRVVRWHQRLPLALTSLQHTSAENEDNRARGR